MSFTAKLFRKAIGAYKEIGMTREKVADVGYSTGFPNFDMRNATSVHVKNQEKGLDYKYYQIGLTDGSLNTIVGRSGSGKSTFTWQICGNIIRPFKTSCIFADEIESGMQDARKEVLTSFVGEELQDRVISRNTGITSENFYERIKLIHDMRVENFEELEYDTGYLDYRGNKIFKLEPCCYILDSWALLRPANLVDEEQISGQMSVTSAAKMNTEILRRIIPMLKNANILLFIINHILKDVKINPYEKSLAQVQYLDPGERFPGGDTAIYLANNLIKLVDYKITEKNDYKFIDIDGVVVECKILKSRTNKAGKSTFLVYNQSTGYDPEWSLFVTLKKDGMIEAKGSKVCLKGYPDYTFYQKNFKDELKKPEFRQMFMAFAMDYLKKMVDQEIEEEAQALEKNLNIVNDFYSAINYNTLAA